MRGAGKGKIGNDGNLHKCQRGTDAAGGEACVEGAGADGRAAGGVPGSLPSWSSSFRALAWVWGLGLCAGFWLSWPVGV